MIIESREEYHKLLLIEMPARYRFIKFNVLYSSTFYKNNFFYAYTMLNWIHNSFDRPISFSKQTIDIIIVSPLKLL